MEFIFKYMRVSDIYINGQIWPFCRYYINTLQSCLWGSSISKIYFSFLFFRAKNGAYTMFLCSSWSVVTFPLLELPHFAHSHFPSFKFISSDLVHKLPTNLQKKHTNAQWWSQFGYLGLSCYLQKCICLISCDLSVTWA